MEHAIPRGPHLTHATPAQTADQLVTVRDQLSPLHGGSIRDASTPAKTAGAAAATPWPTYLVIEQSPSLTGKEHDRCRPGLNHLAFHIEDAFTVEKMVTDAAQHGWRLMFPERHPYAGGTQHYAGYLENDDGFEVELVAITPPERGSDSGHDVVGN
ncbi:hypothetical protein [Streptomyces sp. NPDC005549]|uniref:hypothetical protein n=1 Tax=Streptomyces sp. NPDC005549 TaxID=3154888 RepID=UPI0033AF8171